MAAPLVSPIKKKAAEQVMLDEPNMRNIVLRKFPKVFDAAQSGPGSGRYVRDIVQHLDKGRWCMTRYGSRYHVGGFQNAYSVYGNFVLLIINRKRKKAHNDQAHRNPPNGKGAYQFTFVSNPKDPSKKAPYKKLGTQSGPVPGYKIIVCGRLETDNDKSFTCFGEVKPVTDTAYSYYSTEIDSDGKKIHKWRFEMCDVPYPAPQIVDRFLYSLLD